VGESYSYPMTATGAPIPTFALVDVAPDGMVIDPTSGLITWTPTTPGLFAVTVQASNSAGVASQSFTVDVTQVPAIISAAVATATVGEFYSYQIEASGFPDPSFALLDPVPAGMVIDPVSGLITWTPTAPGPFAVTVQVSNSAGVTSKSFTIDVTANPGERLSFNLYLALIYGHNR
jgi:PKD repeat protein